MEKRIIPCLDIHDGRTVKGVNFINLKDAGDPIELAIQYSSQGADELVFLDISATNEGRKATIKLVSEIAQQINIPFTVGGGISELKDAELLLNAGANKISINSAALRNPDLIAELSKTFGKQSIIVAVDTRHHDGKNHVYLNGGRVKTDWETEGWIEYVESLGAGEILLTSMDHDGTKNGFDYELLKKINQSLSIPLIASGGAGKIEDFVELFRSTNVNAALAASVFHYGEILIPHLKKTLISQGINVRLV